MVSMMWLRDRRKELNMTQDDLARELQLLGFDVARSAVGHWETGLSQMPLGNPSFVASLAKALRMDVMTVLRFSGYEITTQHSEISERAARLIDTLPDDKQALALRLVEALLA
jgi:transcriptional regulator with XRE-family HTH domain